MRTSATRGGAITCPYKQAGSPMPFIPDFLKSIQRPGKYSLALRGTFANYDDQTSRFWVFHIRLKLPLTF
jgi:hypothetical protein